MYVSDNEFWLEWNNDHDSLSRIFWGLIEYYSGRRNREQFPEMHFRDVNEY